MSYSVYFHPEAKKDLDSLDTSVRIIALKQIKKLKENPYAGEGLGNKAGIDLTGYRKLYFLKKKYRIVYKIIEKEIIILIIAIGKREKSEVYKSVKRRI